MPNPDPVVRAQRDSRRRIAIIAAMGMAFGAVLVALPAGAAKEGFPRSFNPETAPGFTNTFSTKDVLSPHCAEAIAATPGSDPATKVLNNTLNNAASFQPGGTVHFTYLDNPHTNPGTQNFTIQDCVVTYPAGFFSASDFDPVTGVLINPEYNKQRLTKGETQIDGAALSGIRSSVGNIYFSWTAPDDIAFGTWVCNFARDIRNNHGGGGNRKAPPTCYQVPPPPTTTTTAGPGEPTTTSTTLPPTTTTTLPPTTTTTLPPTTTTTLPPPFVPPGIFLGYADTLHGTAPGTQFTPDPWQGDPGVVFLGCTPGTTECGVAYDGGAIRIDNVGAGPLTLTAAQVDIMSISPGGTCVYRTWDGLLPATAGPGGTIVLTQTGLLGPPQPAPCNGRVSPPDRPLTNFDTSEGPLDTIDPPFSNCNPDDSIVQPPVIRLTFQGGATMTIVDRMDPVIQTDEILTTGGVDRFACTGVEEATPWVAVPLANITVTP